MNRTDAHRAFCAAYVSLVPQTHPDTVEEAFARWWTREGHETAMERGTRVHREAEAAYSRGTIVMVRCVPGLTYQVGMRVRLEHTTETAARVEPCNVHDPESIGTVKRIDANNTLTVHMDPPPTVKIDTSKADPRVLAEKVAKLDEQRQLGMYQPLLQVHDEMIWDIPDNLTNATTATSGRPAYRCENKSCPERSPLFADKAPKCYTCDRPMTVVADAGDLVMSRSGDLKMLTGVAALVEQLRVKLAANLGVPAKYLGLDTQPKLNGWYGGADKMAREMLDYPDRRKDVGDAIWGPSLLPSLLSGMGPSGLSQVDQLAELRRMTPQAWGRYVRGENPPPQIPRKPNKEEDYRVGDAIRHQILIGTGETLDKIGRLVLGLFRRPGPEHPEPDADFRERLLAAMEPRRLMPGGEWFADTDAGVPYWETKPDTRIRTALRSGFGTKDDVRLAFEMVEHVEKVEVESPGPGHVEITLMMRDASRHEIENAIIEARQVARDKLPAGVRTVIHVNLAGKLHRLEADFSVEV